MFIGRKEELRALEEVKTRKGASLICVMGRRRIGKSTLVQHFAKNLKTFIEIQGLMPKKSTTSIDQIKYFTDKVAEYFDDFPPQVESWERAFSYLASKTKNRQVLIFLDEISWMGSQDELFSAKLKSAWDTQFKKNNKLMMVVCGSVSSWIEDNLLKNASFEGRFSLELRLNELSFLEINEFWKAQKINLSTKEKLLILAITGGVPRYLEEINSRDVISRQITNLCFKSSGFFFNEFEKIFTEIFNKKTKTYEKIIRAAIDGHPTISELALSLKTDVNAEFLEHIHVLELSGFLARDYFYHLGGRQGKLSQIRVKDNYLRFFIKEIGPRKDKIENKIIQIESLSDLKNYHAILGYQFENLILANRDYLHEKIGIDKSSVISSFPHKQNKTTKNKGGCQIDLLIETDLQVLYVCEFKCSHKISKAIIAEMKEKLFRLKVPKGYATKPILVYEGEIYPPHAEEIEAYFYKIIHFLEI